MRILVYGAGSWGTALAQILVDNNHDVILYGNDTQVVDEINTKHTNSRYFGDKVILPTSLKASNSYVEYINNIDAIVIAVPTNAYREVLTDINKNLNNKIIFISVGKGFDPSTEKRLSDTIREIIDESKRYPIVSLIGPSHAEEVIIRLLTCVTSTCLDIETGKIVQKLFSNNYFRVYTNTDEVGAEYAAAIKNVLAIASGIVSGLGLGDNSRAALMTRGLAEMVRFGIKQGGQLTTYLGLTGIGDLLVTCTSYHSRNFQAGLQIGKANSAKEFLKNNKMTVEGIRTAKVINDMCKIYNVEMPVVNGVYKILYEDVKPSTVLTETMNRPLKNEF
jgi:glycerol-3-phosphate dehydrogenase (NAD(P)+)